MISLDNIPKKNVFTVPDGYFEKLPARIQSRIPTGARDTARDVWHRYGFRLAVPLAVVVGAVFFYFASSRTEAETVLASVETADLILYFQETSLGLTTEELLEDLEISTGDVEAIENEVYGLHLEQGVDELLELELNNL